MSIKTKKLKFQDEINKIENCPSSNLNGNLEVYRLLKTNPASEDDIVPYSVLKPKYKNNCLAWGLSVWSSSLPPNELINLLSNQLKEQVKYAGYFEINNEMGVKHKSGKNYHYTYFPNEDIDLLNIFEIENI